MFSTCRSQKGDDIGGPQEDIFESLLGSPDTELDQNTPQSINVEPHCTVITWFNCSLYTPNALLVGGNILLLSLQSKILPKNKSATYINGYNASSSSEYFHNFIITSEFNCSSMLVIHSSCCVAGSASTLVDDHLLVSFFGPDVALCKSPILLYGTSAGQIFYVPVPVHDTSSCTSELKSHLLLSLGQAIVDIFVVRLCEELVNLLIFVGKDGMVCVLTSYDKGNFFKEFCLNIPVCSTCFVGNKLLLSSYYDVTVVNFDFKCDDKSKASFCLNTALSAAFSNANTIRITGVLKMCVDTSRSTVIVAKGNGHIYTIDESYLTNYSTLKGNDLQKAVTQVCEISKKVDGLKDNLKVTETSIKEVNNVMVLFHDLNVGIGNFGECLFTCQLQPKVYCKDIGVELQLTYHGTLILSNDWYICVCFTFPKFHHQLCFRLPHLNGGNTITHLMKVAEKSLPFHVKCILYHTPNGTRAPVGVSVLLKQETFDVLNFVKVSDENLPRSSACTVKGCLRVSKNSLKKWDDGISTNDVSLINNLFSCRRMGKGQLTFQDSCVIVKASNSAVAYLYKTIQEYCVVVNLLTNSPSFICELRAAIFERLKVIIAKLIDFNHTVALIVFTFRCPIIFKQHVTDEKSATGE